MITSKVHKQELTDGMTSWKMVLQRHKEMERERTKERTLEGGKLRIKYRKDARMEEKGKDV